MIIVILISFLFVISCDEKEIEFENLYSYKNDKNICDSLGRPANDSVSYFPIEYLIDGNSRGIDPYINYRHLIYSDLKVYQVAWSSGFFHEMKEPILSNCYLNKEIIRFTLGRTFHPTIIIRIEKKDKDIIVIERKNVVFTSENKDENNNHYLKIDSTQIIEKISNFKYDDWLNLIELIKRSSSELIPSALYEMPIDGSNWLLEIHTKKGFYFFDRCSPNPKEYPAFRKICEYILDLSSFKNEERY
ncbi:MAG TPA: hypothetical protein PK762_10220 [Candidatus Kapabacteria bacterium]|nr:hypothetical protein [Candidatus Kapabacteria bacterium]